MFLLIVDNLHSQRDHGHDKAKECGNKNTAKTLQCDALLLLGQRAALQIGIIPVFSLKFLEETILLQLQYGIAQLILASRNTYVCVRETEREIRA